jgi:dTDP-4-amino-4,6-dideoxygalactose transaminase
MQSKGKHQRSEHETPSVAKTDLYKYKFSEWQASILLRQLLKLGEIFEKRQALYSYYDTHINNDIIKKPEINSDAVCCRYAVLVEERDCFYNECINAGVDLDFSHCSLGCPNSFTKEHQMADQILNLPFDINLSRNEINHVVAVVNSIK